MTADRHTQARLAARRLCYDRQGRRIVDDVSATFAAGTVTALCGPNGSGKTTLLRLLAGQAAPTGGGVTLDGVALADLPRRRLARTLAVLPQQLPVPEGLSVRELVAFGRHPHRAGLFSRRDPEPGRVDWALDAADCRQLAGRALAALSGGERQRAWLAMALAQTRSVLLLDEPTTFLDVQHRLELMGLVRRLSREQGLAVVWVLHELNEAAAYSDRMLLLHGGAIAARGRPEEVLTAEALQRVFAVQADILRHPRSGRPVFLAAAC